MSTLPEEEITFEAVARELIAQLGQKAETLRAEAGLTGEFIEQVQEVETLERLIEAFRAGVEQRIPADWHAQAQEIRKHLVREARQRRLETDPEYAEFLRLCRKFRNEEEVPE